MGAILDNINHEESIKSWNVEKSSQTFAKAFIESFSYLFVVIMRLRILFSNQHIQFALNIITQIAFGYCIRNSKSIPFVRYDIICVTAVLSSFQPKHLKQALRALQFQQMHPWNPCDKIN